LPILAGSRAELVIVSSPSPSFYADCRDSLELSPIVVYLLDSHPTAVPPYRVIGRLIRRLFLDVSVYSVVWAV